MKFKDILDVLSLVDKQGAKVRIREYLKDGTVEDWIDDYWVKIDPRILKVYENMTVTMLGSDKDGLVIGFKDE